MHPINPQITQNAISHIPFMHIKFAELSPQEYKRLAVQTGINNEVNQIKMHNSIKRTTCHVSRSDTESIWKR